MINAIGPTSSPSPSGTPTATATATSTATATVAGTPSPSSTPTVSPSVSPTPTSTPSVTITPMPSPTPSGTPSPGSVFGNISTRLRVETGNNVLIGGFIITGTEPKRVILRAIGPSLSAFLSGVLADPVLELHDSAGTLLALDDNWRTGRQEAEIMATGIPPTNDLES